MAIASCLPVAAADEPTHDLAQQLRGVKFTHFARADDYSEGPTWREGEVFFCSGGLRRVLADGRVEKYLDISPAGTVLRGDGHLLIADNRHHALLDLSPEGKLVVLADTCDGQPLASLNDLTIDAAGNVYWTDPHNSSLDNPVGSVFRVTPAGDVSRVAGGMAFPNGLDVDPASKYLYVVESQSKQILRFALPEGDGPLGPPDVFHELGGSGGDGCAFDAASNLWVADYHRPETKRGRVIVISPAGAALATLDVPAEVVSNIAFGGPDHDQIFCTTGGPAGVFQAAVGVTGFKGHPGVAGTPLREIVIDPAEPASPLHPRRFGQPRGVEGIRGWYIWQTWDPETWTAEVAKESTGETYNVRVLPWATTYRHLAYGARPDDLLPGERVNLFFAPDERHARGYLVHFQDELCQMQGHGHAWRIESVADVGHAFSARAMAGNEPLEEAAREFTLDDACETWHEGQVDPDRELQAGDDVFLTWRQLDDGRVVTLLADAESLDAIRQRERQRIDEQIAREGIAGQVVSVDGANIQFMAFATHWPHANALRPGQTVRLTRTAAGYRPTGETIALRVVSQQNRGAYGSGVNDVVLEADDEATAATVREWLADRVVRLIPGE
jgi:gluconolactonase